IGERGGDADRTVEIGHRAVQGSGLGTLDLPLDLANALEVLIDANAVGYPDAALESRDVFAEGVEQARTAAQCRLPRGGTAALAEEPLEDDARMRLGGER